MAVRPDPQIAIEELVIDDEALETALEEREAAKEAAAGARKAYDSAHEVAKGRILELGLGDRTARCGRFVIGMKSVDGHAVAFETSPTTRLTISPVVEP